ncbi:PulJ/GspJ family protein [Thalassotalea atypica]|uniref:PulJ/GspJ family protein n=1 Tax=Thalassotalea atypica TaxID=2054316 RepID=UPI002573EBB0|nr:prepilin-type N-terminal cleavage/methylation domain-containing protein [Thalassotalea atypica]
MVTPRTKNSGFTLIELMLATSLLMMVLFSGYYAYSLYTQKWQKRVDTFWQGTQDGIAFDSINRMLASAMPYVIKNSQKKAEIYFKASSEEIEWVTASAIFSQDAALVNISVVQDGNLSKLIYKEKPMQNFVLINENQINTEAPEFWVYQVTLLSDIKTINFSFYGWQSFEEALMFVNEETNIDPRNQPERAWYSTHQPQIKRILPEQIQITVQQIAQLHEFNVQLPVATIYALMSHIRKDID